jgi:hypothetical protein
VQATQAGLPPYSPLISFAAITPMISRFHYAAAISIFAASFVFISPLRRHIFLSHYAAITPLFYCHCRHFD